jgi:hypothetical protein
MRRPAGHAPKNGKLHPPELFSEKDVVLHWSTVRKTVSIEDMIGLASARMHAFHACGCALHVCNAAWLT